MHRIYTERETLRDISLAVSQVKQSRLFSESDCFQTTILDGLELMFIGIGFTFVPIVVLLYRRINAQRDREMAEGKEGGIARFTPTELRDMGDRAPDFRYIL